MPLEAPVMTARGLGWALLMVGSARGVLPERAAPPRVPMVALPVQRSSGSPKSCLPVRERRTVLDDLAIPRKQGSSIPHMISLPRHKMALRRSLLGRTWLRLLVLGLRDKRSEHRAIGSGRA